MNLPNFPKNCMKLSIHLVYILGRIFQLCLVHQKDGKMENYDLIDEVTLHQVQLETSLKSAYSVASKV